VSSFCGIPDVLKSETIDYGEVAHEARLELEQVRGRQFSYVLPLEIGGGNTFIPMAAAAKRNVPVVDADGGRRAIPSLTTSTYNAIPLSILSMARDQTEKLSLVSQNSAVLNRCFPPIVLQAEPFKQGVALAMWAMSGAQMKTAIVPGSISYALRLGYTIRQAIEQHHDPVEGAITYVHGKLLFKGQVKSAKMGVPTASVGAVTLVNGDQLGYTGPFIPLTTSSQDTGNNQPA
jgi:DUF917 family protein